VLPVLRSQANKPEIFSQWKAREYRLVRMEKLSIFRIGPSPGRGQGSVTIGVKCIYAYTGNVIFNVYVRKDILEAKFECKDRKGRIWYEERTKEISYLSEPIKVEHIPYWWSKKPIPTKSIGSSGRKTLPRGDI